MIRVYVVDDEKLVRRGIIGLIDWEKYDMEVVGDSGSSEEALRFLGEKGADILFSDLEMSGLSGIPFLQQVRQSFPGLQLVVLTMHQEFELIQQALRIGILDYITKAQIDEENVDVTVIVKDGTDPEDAAFCGAEAIKIINDQVAVQDFGYAESTEDYFGGLYQDNVIRLKIYEESAHQAGGDPIFETTVEKDEYEEFVIE